MLKTRDAIDYEGVSNGTTIVQLTVNDGANGTVVESLTVTDNGCG